MYTVVIRLTYYMSMGRGPCLYNVFAQLLPFLFFGACHRPDSKKSEYIFLRHSAPADVHLTASGPPGKKFGHPCSIVFGGQASENMQEMVLSSLGGNFRG